MKKKLLSIVLALSMLCAFVPLVATSADATSGTNAQSMDNARTMLKVSFSFVFSSHQNRF